MKEQFINAMRTMVSGVTVVTTNGISGLHGATVGSLVSVSVDPPSLLICLRSASGIAQAVNENNSFCANIISVENKSIASRFSGADDEVILDRFEGIDFITHKGGQPVIKNSTSIICNISKVIPYSTHDIIIASVEDVIVTDISSLAYSGGQYRSINLIK